MKKLLILLVCMSFIGCAGVQQNEELTEFAIQTMAMTIGFEMQDSFNWTPEVQVYYDQVMAGNLTLSAASTAEAYLKKTTHPLIANRMVRLAEMTGFDVVGDSVIGIENVDIKLLQTAFTGFRTGLELK